ncbi:MAG: hemerythrin family protein [Lachnospiraceae bacterium]|nr:hemerythrin family protein [Lachnospiraceae bacterium]
MEKIEWDKKFNIGVGVVDKAHVKLFRIMKKLLEISEDTGTYPHIYQEGIKYLEAYSMTHFSEEEEYMRSIRYGGYARHKQIHDNFRDKTLVSLKRDLELSSYSGVAVQRFVGTMSNWLAEHIMREDQAIVGRDVGRKGYDFSSQAATISKALNRTMQDVFQVEAKLVNTDYKGENIGNGFYCYQCYDIEGGIRLQLLLGMEEPLFLRGVSRIFGMQTIQQSEVNRAAWLIFRSLFQDMGKLFQAEAEDEFKKENLLTKDEFRKDFMKGYPCSLLFSTKLGYFVFCYRSWRVRNPKAENGKTKG